MTFPINPALERLAMSDTEKLTWDDVEQLCRRLFAQYPDMDPLDLPDDEVARMIAALPEFADGQHPKSGTTLDAVRSTWTEFYEGHI
ncbi:Fe-S cluster assembly protein IscX [Telmatospirillum siberiense]|uniref:Fe-S assembly protein IscX n=1 Tax=Telmatospirillum siberiense TaxID=382514 RepID=A0A2N3PNI3_9PROT|nr:Fe-S cluster assembly protein IscX [Telmatospirillum siberiense]PKU21964.1 hypothetical protein CWS72_23970 [Telmatospirillum siberiense]